jgi:organic hydroperoxide reductase OsmC/OhrA
MTKIERVLYTARVHTTGGRDDASHSDDGRLDIKLSPPGITATAPTLNSCLAPAGQLVFLARWLV